jgi:ubiquinone/menaquinone biosynthesis C-methylase UbiE
MTARAVVVDQFRRPTGVAGHIAGWIMAMRASNRERNRWTVSLLGIGTGDRVLELGFGPGYALGLAVDAVGATGHVVGIDHSIAMLAQAARRHRKSIAEGRLELHHMTISEAHSADWRFDRILSSNVLQFETDQRGALAALRGILRPGGRIATTFQPRTGAATRDHARRFAEEIMRLKYDAGFVRVREYLLQLEPVPAVCIVAEAPSTSPFRP